MQPTCLARRERSADELRLQSLGATSSAEARAPTLEGPTTRSPRGVPDTDGAPIRRSPTSAAPSNVRSDPPACSLRARRARGCRRPAPHASRSGPLSLASTQPSPSRNPTRTDRLRDELAGAALRHPRTRLGAASRRRSAAWVAPAPNLCDANGAHRRAPARAISSRPPDPDGLPRASLDRPAGTRPRTPDATHPTRPMRTRHGASPAMPGILAVLATRTARQPSPRALTPEHAPPRGSTQDPPRQPRGADTPTNRPRLPSARPPPQ